MSADDWADPDAADRACVRCAEHRRCLLLPDPVALAADPGQTDTLTHGWWCRPCYYRRKDEV